MVAIGRASTVIHVFYYLMSHPGLSPLLVEQMFELIKISDNGLTVLLVSKMRHNRFHS